MDFGDGQGEDSGGEVDDQDTGQLSEGDLGQMRETEDPGQIGGEDPDQMEDSRDSEDGWWISSQIYPIILIWFTEEIPPGPDVLGNAGSDDHEDLDGENEINDTLMIRF